MQNYTFKDEQHTFIAPTWADLDAAAFDISKKILKDGKSFDRLVTLAKGGWPMTRSLVDYLSIREVASIGVKFYSGIGERRTTPEVYQDIPVSIKGEKVLLFDDVVDSGESMRFVIDYLHHHGVQDITTASLYYKPHATMKPDYYSEETSSWILFPYDLRDSLEQLGGKWKTNGVSREEIVHRFTTLGFNQHVTAYYQNSLLA